MLLYGRSAEIFCLDSSDWSRNFVFASEPLGYDAASLETRTAVANRLLTLSYFTFVGRAA